VVVLAGAGRFGVSRGYNYQILAPKGSGGVAGAHQARKRRKGPSEVDGDADRRRSGDGDRGRGSAAVLRASGCRIQLVASLGRRTRGQRGPRSYGGEQLLGSGLTGGDGFGSKIPARHGENLGAVVPRRVAGPWRSCGAANGGLGCGGAARGHGGAVLCSHGAGGEAARVCGRRGERMGCRAAAGGAKIEAGGDPGGSRSMVTPP